MQKTKDERSSQHPTPIPWLVVLHVFLPVLTGGTVYLSWRSSSLLVFRWVDSCGFTAPLASWRRAAFIVVHVVPQWLLFSRPDALWVYALTALMVLIWSGVPHERASSLWVASGAILGCGGELAQAVGLVRGTYDPVDLTLSAVAGVMACSVIKRSMFRELGGSDAATRL
jgi:hypothetical protein